jgi:hypothetical protein
MGSDDICAPDRFEKQPRFLAATPKIDAMGRSIAEFADHPAKLQTVRRCPEAGRIC